MTELTRRDFVRAGGAGAVGLWLPFRVNARPLAESSGVRARALAELRRRLRGPLLLPGDPRYPAARRPANAQFNDLHPAAVAQCADQGRTDRDRR